MELDIQKYTDLAVQGTLSYLPKIVGALVVIFIGFKIAGAIGRLIEKILKAKDFDPTIEAFFGSLIKNLLKALVVVAAIGILGVETSSIAALIASVGIAVGMALSGTLSHFASGIMILLFKPFKVGDVIETAGHKGAVVELQIFNTILETPQGKTIIIPNAQAVGSSITNFSTVSEKRVDLTVGIGYGDNIDTARKVLLEVAKNNEYSLKDKDVVVGVKELADSSVNLAFNVWVKSEDAIAAPLSLTEDVKKAFDETEGLNFPFPQRDVHLFNNN